MRSPVRRRQLTKLRRLVKEAAIHSKQAGERGLTARGVRKAARVRFPRRMRPGTPLANRLEQDALAKFKG